MSRNGGLSIVASALLAIVASAAPENPPTEPVAGGGAPDRVPETGQGRPGKIFAGEITVLDFLEFLSYHRGVPVLLVTGGGSDAPFRKMIRVVHDMNATYEIVKAILETSGFTVSERTLPDGTEIIEVAAAAAKPGSDTALDEVQKLAASTGRVDSLRGRSPAQPSHGGSPAAAAATKLPAAPKLPDASPGENAPTFELFYVSERMSLERVARGLREVLGAAGFAPLSTGRPRRAGDVVISPDAKAKCIVVCARSSEPIAIARAVLAIMEPSGEDEGFAPRRARGENRTAASEEPRARLQK